MNGVRIAAAMPNGECRYFLTDQVDSVNVVLNDKGDAVTRTEYKPYGETWIQEGDKTNRPKFNSQELDPETGYYFYNARYYEAEIGRFITADNIIDGEYSTQGWNRFSYVKNNPVRYKDPSGNLSKEQNLANFGNNFATIDDSQHVEYMDDSMVPKDVAYFRKKVLSRGGKWSDSGVNVVAIRDSSAPAKAGMQKADDLFIVYNGNKVQGYFRGTTEPGVERWTDKKGNTSEQIGGVAHLIPGDYTYKKEDPLSGNAARSKGYFNSVGSLPVWRDKNKDGKIDSEEKVNSERSKHSSIDIQNHWMGAGSYIDNYSQGCQGVKGKSYMDPRGNIKTISDLGSRRGAYEAYIEQAGSKGIMQYHLFNKSDIDQTKYNSSGLLNFIPEK